MKTGLSIRLLFSFLIFGLSGSDCALSQSRSSELDQRPTDVEAKQQKLSAPYGTHLEPILKTIAATPEQRKIITAILMSYKPKIAPLRKQYKEESQEFLKWIISGMSSDKVMARQGELNNLYGIIVTQYSMMRIEIRRHLTPEQCKLMEQYRQKQGWTSH